MLNVSHLTIQAYDKVLLQDVSFGLEKGKVYGLIGHNGSGKSTLIKALAGETAPTSGEILLNGQAIHKMPAKQLAQHLAYLPQKLPDAPHFLVDELVMLGRYPHQGWLQKPSEDDKAIVNHCMQMTGVAPFAKQSVATLSGGEKARAWLAMCLAQQSEVLLLDEPLAPLDIVYQVEILKLIQKLAKDNNMAIVIIIHDINLTAQFCDEIIALKQGALCHIGDIQSTMRVDVLKQIFGIELAIFEHPVTKQKVAVV